MSRQAITNFFPNTNITALQAQEWKLLLTRYATRPFGSPLSLVLFLKLILTRIGETAMYHLLLNTSIFVALPNDSFCQLVGTPITELKPRTLGFLSAKTAALDHNPKPPLNGPTDENRRPPKRRRVEDAVLTVPTAETAPEINDRYGKSVATRSANFGFSSYMAEYNTFPSRRTPADISFSRVRIFYARPVMTKDTTTGHKYIAIGLPPNREAMFFTYIFFCLIRITYADVLHRLAPVKLLANGDVPSRGNIAGRDARHVLKHIFPRQFGLRHPFDSTHDFSGNGFKFEDYTVREQEIQVGTFYLHWHHQRMIYRQDERKCEDTKTIENGLRFRTATNQEALGVQL